jgi:hypothetical protein
MNALASVAMFTVITTVNNIITVVSDDVVERRLLLDSQ